MSGNEAYGYQFKCKQSLNLDSLHCKQQPLKIYYLYNLFFMKTFFWNMKQHAAQGVHETQQKKKKKNKK